MISTFSMEKERTKKRMGRKTKITIVCHTNLARQELLNYFPVIFELPNRKICGI